MTKRTVGGKQAVWLARHGNRADYVDPAWPETAARPDDPPLSDDGMAQAKQLAERLVRENLRYILASPFLRALETANAVAERLELPIWVETGVSELLLRAWYAAYPEYLSLPEAAARFPRIDPDYVPLVRPRFPETEAAMKERVSKTIRQVLARRTEGDILIVAHGAPVRSIAYALVGEVQTVTSPLCCLIKVVEDGGRWRLALDGSDVSYLKE